MLRKIFLITLLVFALTLWQGTQAQNQTLVSASFPQTTTDAKVLLEQNFLFYGFVLNEHQLNNKQKQLLNKIANRRKEYFTGYV